jgi:DNA mismatch endonuclease (patch repair protein)
VDRLSPKQRSDNMSRIGSKDTEPELAVRSTLHKLGYRFRLHRRDLPGTPDIVLPKHRTVIFVHGCFWHRHRNCRLSYTPKSNLAFWQQKFGANVARDHRVRQHLRRLGWRVRVLWECQTTAPDVLAAKLRAMLANQVANATRIRPAGPARKCATSPARTSRRGCHQGGITK